MLVRSLGPPVLASLLTAVFTWLELITSKYPRTFFLLKRCLALYVYVIIYAAVGFGVMLGLRFFNVKLEGPGVSSLWVQAVIVGISIKAFLHIRLFSVAGGGQSFPIGVETVVQVFEPSLLRAIDVYHFEAGKDFIGARATKYSDLRQVKDSIGANLPITLPQQERAAFLADVERATTPREAMELYLSFLGKRSFNSVFPA